MMSKINNTSVSGPIENFSDALQTSADKETIIINTLKDGPYKDLNSTLDKTISKINYIQTLQGTLSSLTTQYNNLGSGGSSSSSTPAPTIGTPVATTFGYVGGNTGYQTIGMATINAVLTGNPVVPAKSL